MNQKDKFNDILNQCLDRMLRGETVEQCLRIYPEQAGQLEPLLLTAQKARAASAIQPREDYKARATYEFQSAVRDMLESKTKRKFPLSWQWRWQSGWAIALVVVIVVGLGGGGTMAASSSSMPDSALYTIKLASEQARLAITLSDVGKAELNAAFADRRTAEIVYMASKGDAQQVQIVAQRLSTNLENINNLVMSKTGYRADTANGGEVPATTMVEDRSVLPPSEQKSQEPTVGVDVAPALAPVPAAAGAPTAKAVAPAPTVGSSLPEPAPGVELGVPVATATSAPAVGGQGLPATLKATETGTSDLRKIQQIWMDSFSKNRARLEEALETVSPEVRPAIRQAIAKSTAEYEKTLRNIERAEKAD
jgi:hypothetical protein